MSWLEIIGIIFLSFLAIPIVSVIIYTIYSIIMFVGRIAFVCAYIALSSFSDQTNDNLKRQEDTIDYISKSQKERYFELKKELAELKGKIENENKRFV